MKESIDRISYTATSKKEVVELQQDLSNGFWTVLRPSQKSIDMRRKFFYGETFLSLEAVGVVEEPTQEQIDIIQDRLTLHLLGGDLISIGFSRPFYRYTIGYRSSKISFCTYSKSYFGYFEKRFYHHLTRVWSR